MRNGGPSGPCAFCGSPDTRLLLVTDDNRRISEHDFRYRRCAGCRSLELIDVPEDLARYYAGEYHQLPAPEELDRRARRDGFKVDILNGFISGGRLLEIGPGMGSFARIAQLSGFEVSAIESDERCCHFLQSRLGIPAIRTTHPEEELPAVGRVRVVALWHSLEHLPDPLAVLDVAAEALEPGGVIVIATPNPSAFSFAALGARWPHLDAPRHLSLLDLEIVSARLARSGCQRVLATTRDPGGIRWNLFSWQRWLMNRTRSRVGSRAALLAGTALGAAMSPLDLRRFRGSAYTAVFRKDVA